MVDYWATAKTSKEGCSINNVLYLHLEILQNIFLGHENKHIKEILRNYPLNNFLVGEIYHVI